MCKVAALFVVAALIAVSLLSLVSKAKGYSTQHMYEVARIERQCLGKE